MCGSKFVACVLCCAIKVENLTHFIQQDMPEHRTVCLKPNPRDVLQPRYLADRNGRGHSTSVPTDA